MHPILFQIGSFRLPTYGPILALALVAALYTVVRLGRREGLDTGILVDFSTWVIIAALIGAKILMIVTDWTYYGYKNHPARIFSLSTLQAGGVFYGGLIGAILFAIVYIRVQKLPARKLFDVCAPAVVLGQAIGRWGCFAAGDDYGTPTHSFLGVIFTNPYAHQLSGTPLGVRLWPVQLIESAACFAIFGFLIWRYGHKRRDGEIFLLYIVLYAVVRFLDEFIRGDPDRGFVFHHLLSTSQFIALLALAAAPVLAWRWFRGPQAVIVEAPAAGSVSLTGPKPRASESVASPAGIERRR